METMTFHEHATCRICGLYGPIRNNMIIDLSVAYPDGYYCHRCWAKRQLKNWIKTAMLWDRIRKDLATKMTKSTVPNCHITKP